MTCVVVHAYVRHLEMISRSLPDGFYVTIHIVRDGLQLWPLHGKARVSVFITY